MLTDIPTDTHTHIYGQIDLQKTSAQMADGLKIEEQNGCKIKKKYQNRLIVLIFAYFGGLS